MLIAVALAQRQNVLIHSTRGQNRAAAVVTAYCALATAKGSALYVDQSGYSDAGKRMGCERCYGACPKGLV
jgi:protein tyrosine/serine phosphatase